MSKDILSVIQANMSTFSKGQKLIAAFILDSYDKAAFMTASKLGKTVNVSESTVVRFAAISTENRLSSQILIVFGFAADWDLYHPKNL